MRVMKVRDLIRRMNALGATPLRMEGSHEVWELPRGGGRIPIVVNHKNDDVTPAVMATVRRKFRAVGLAL